MSGPTVGEAAPAFTLPASDGKTISLSEFAGKQPVLLYFYPKDDTPGCTAEACSFRDNLGVLQAKGIAVLGVSPDSPKAHDKFSAKYGLSFPLLSDADHQMAESYGVWVEKSMYGRKYWGMERSTFLIGTDGTVQKIWRKVDPKKHVPQIIAELS